MQVFKKSKYKISNSALYCPQSLHDGYVFTRQMSHSGLSVAVQLRVECMGAGSLPQTHTRTHTAIMDANRKHWGIAGGGVPHRKGGMARNRDGTPSTRPTKP